MNQFPTNPQAALGGQDFHNLCRTYSLFESKDEIFAFLLTTLKHVANSKIPSKEQTRICEVGCGFGRFYEGLMLECGNNDFFPFTYFGFDANSEYLEMFSKAHPKADTKRLDIFIDDLSVCGVYDVVVVPYTLIQLFPFEKQVDFVGRLLPLLDYNGILIIDMVNPLIGGYSGNVQLPMSLPMTNGELMRFEVFLGTVDWYKHIGKYHKLDYLENVPYTFGATSKQEFVVFKKPVPEAVALLDP
jgi:SAM-dependent methyltransferase